MNICFVLPDEWMQRIEHRPFLLFREQIAPALEARRALLQAMYDPQIGRPELDPVLLCSITLLQIMEKLPDRAALAACMADVRWRYALGLPPDWRPFDPSTLVYFRQRMARHGAAQLVLQAGLDAMRQSGYLSRHTAVRIDSTHVLGNLAKLSRLECMRETLHLALEFLSEFEGAWEPWRATYRVDYPAELRKTSPEKLRACMEQAGQDAKDILARAQALGDAVVQAAPVALLARVFKENFMLNDAGQLVQTQAQPAGAVRNPHEPEAQWSTKSSITPAGWEGYKTQVCETVPEQPCAKNEPTASVITAMVTQPATTSDQGSLAGVLDIHQENGQAAPAAAYTDAGYVSGPELARAKQAGLEICGPVPAPPHSAQRLGTDAFHVDLQARTAVCPAGHASTTCAQITERKDGRTYYYFEWATADCSACPLRAQCLSKKKKQARRSIQVSALHEYTQARRELCKDPDYQRRMRRRNAIEGTHSECKRRYGMGRARYRGLQKTNLQMQFIAAACNLRRWARRMAWLARHAA